jgi:ADP-ribosylglycohydrolase
MNISAEISRRDRIRGGLWGSLIGDALGVPVEFINRTAVQSNPVISMREFGTHHQPRGTWSDDGALILCTADSLLNHEFDLDDMGKRFLDWMKNGKWTAWGEPFDIGMTTADAILRIENGVAAMQAGGLDEYSNGNGSLMRILPAVLRFAGEPTKLFVSRIERISAITHGHNRSKMACVFYGLVIRQLLLGRLPQAALDFTRTEFRTCYEQSPEFPMFRKFFVDDFLVLPENLIVSTGYVLHTLHASLWCLLTSNNFKDCVLKAVNLGYDTDTTGCVSGGLAGVAYGLPDVPVDWIGQLARRGDLDCLFNKFADLCPDAARKGTTSE